MPQAIRLGMLQKGDQLPTVKEVVASLAINPNTVLKAYKELKHAGLAAGLLATSAGSITVLGGPPASTAQLRRVGFVARDAPAYAGMTVLDHLRFGAWSNDGFDREGALRRVESLGFDLRQRVGKLSGGERAQLALTLASRSPGRSTASSRAITGSLAPAAVTSRCRPGRN